MSDPIRIVQVLIGPNTSEWQSTLVGLTNTGEVYCWSGQEWRRHAHSLHQQLVDGLTDDRGEATDAADGWTHSDKPCDKCGALEVYWQEVGDSMDARIKCRSCGRFYCAEGCDS